MTEAIDALVDLCSEDPARAAKVLGLGHHPGATTYAATPTCVLLPPRVPTRSTPGSSTTTSTWRASILPSRDRASRWLAITSSLFGLVRPGDRIPAYRLSGDVNLPGVGVVSAHWRGVLDPVAREAAGTGLVIDLRSTTYASFWRPGPDLARRVATVRVLQQVGDQRKVVSHFNKATKGRLVRALLEQGADPDLPRRPRRP